MFSVIRIRKTEHGTHCSRLLCKTDTRSVVYLSIHMTHNIKLRLLNDKHSTQRNLFLNTALSVGISLSCQNILKTVIKIIVEVLLKANCLRHVALTTAQRTWFKIADDSAAVMHDSDRFFCNVAPWRHREKLRTTDTYMAKKENERAA